MSDWGGLTDGTSTNHKNGGPKCPCYNREKQSGMCTSAIFKLYELPKIIRKALGYFGQSQSLNGAVVCILDLHSFQIGAPQYPDCWGTSGWTPTDQTFNLWIGDNLLLCVMYNAELGWKTLVEVSWPNKIFPIPLLGCCM